MARHMKGGRKGQPDLAQPSLSSRMPETGKNAAMKRLPALLGGETQRVPGAPLALPTLPVGVFHTRRPGRGPGTSGDSPG